MGSCVACGKATSGSLEFCQQDFKRHKDDILNKKPWVRALKNEEQRARRRRQKEAEDMSLDQIMDRTYEKRW